MDNPPKPEQTTEQPTDEPTMTKPEPSTEPPAAKQEAQAPSGNPYTPSPIIYDLPSQQTALNRVEDLIEETHSKFQARANRFGMETTRRVTEVKVLGARRAAARTGFVSGFDPGCEAQAERRAARAARFGMEETEDRDVVADTSMHAKREERFGKTDRLEVLKDVVGVVTKENLEQRRNVAVGELRRAGVLHVFGVDELETKNVMGYFREYGPSWCEWLNDSSCNVVFEDDFTMRRAMRGISVGLPVEGAEEGPVDRMGDGDGDGGSMGVAGDGVLEEGFFWRRARGIKKKGGVVVPVWVRMATEMDRRPEMPNPKSRWSRTVGEKREEPKREQGQEEEGKEKGRLGVSLRNEAIRKVRRKKISRMDLDKALSSS